MMNYKYLVAMASDTHQSMTKDRVLHLGKQQPDAGSTHGGGGNKMLPCWRLSIWYGGPDSGGVTLTAMQKLDQRRQNMIDYYSERDQEGNIYLYTDLRQKLDACTYHMVC